MMNDMNTGEIAYATFFHKELNYKGLRFAEWARDSVYEIKLVSIDYGTKSVPDVIYRVYAGFNDKLHLENTLHKRESTARKRFDELVKQKLNDDMYYLRFSRNVDYATPTEIDPSWPKERKEFVKRINEERRKG